MFDSSSTFQSDALKATFFRCKKRGGENRSHPNAAKVIRTSNSGPDSKGKSAKTSTASEYSSSRWFSYLCRLPFLLLALFIVCLVQLGNTAEVMFGNTFGNVIFGSLAFFMAILLQYVSQHNNHRVVSGAFL